MLFQRLYNWIKYKTLPPSILFKNRLFVERDSKHRRIFNNFGLTFRNSKWSNYEMYNVKFHFQWTYFKYFFWFTFIFILIIVFTYFKNYYLYSYLMSTVGFLFWISADSFDYYLSFFIWLSIVFASMSINFIYSYLFFSTYSEKQDLKEIFLDNFFNDARLLVTPKHKDRLLNKHEYGRVLYAWLINSISDNRISVLQELFTAKVSTNWWSQYHNFFRSLFKLSQLSRLSDKNSSVPFLQNLCLRLDLNAFSSCSTTLSPFFSLNNLLTNYSNLVSWYTLQHYVSYFLVQQDAFELRSFLGSKNRWNLLEITQESNNYALLLNYKLGGFLMTNFNFSKFSFLSVNARELWPLSFYIKNQTSAGKWNRWLYKYSILHRKILKNSHKLTITKRLINSGYFNSQLFSKNIWASETFKKYDHNELIFSSSFKLLYANLFDQVKHKNYLVNNTTMSINLTTQQSLEMISYYETSYFWFIKRFYFLNTLPSNFFASTLNLKASQISLNLKFDNYLNNYSNTLSYYLSSRSLVLRNFFSFSNLNLKGSLEDNLFLKISYPTNSNYSDFYLLNEENEFFTQENLNLLYWLTLTNLSLHQQVKWSSPFFYTRLNTQFSPSFNSYFDNQLLNYLSFWLTFSDVNSENFFLTDVKDLSMFF